MKTILYAWRIVTRMKAYSAICILGLVISLAGTMTLVRYIHQELTVDHYLKDLDKLHLLIANPSGTSYYMMHNNRNYNNDADYIDPLEHPAVECHTTLYIIAGGEMELNRHHYAVQAIAVDSTFHRLMPREALLGDVNSIPPTGVVISKALSDRIFGKDTDPIGQTLIYGGTEVTVTGVMKPFTSKSSFDYDVMFSHELHREWMGNGASAFSLVKLHRAEDLATINAWQKPQKPSWFGNNEIIYQLIPYKDNYFMHNITIYYSDSFFKKGDKNSIRILVFVTVLLFSIGFVNYLNLYTVIMQKRGLEFGVKKVFGAGSGELFKQLYVENFLLSAVTILFVGMIIEITDKILEHSLGIPIMNNVPFNTAVGVGTLFGFPLLTTLYPYFRYLFKRPISSMKGLQQGGKNVVTRSIFLMVQYVISFSLIVVSIYFAKQLYTMLNADLGFRTENILKCTIIPEYGGDVIRESGAWDREEERTRTASAKIMQQLNNSPNVLGWSLDDDFEKGGGHLGEAIKKADTNDEYINANPTFLPTAYFDIYDLEVIDGRAWNDSIDNQYNYDLIINESAARALGITDIKNERIQSKERIMYSAYQDMSVNPSYNIVGVIKDCRVGHLSKKVVPTIYLYSEPILEHINPGTSLVIRYQEGKQREVIELLSKLRNEVSGDGELEYSFVKDEIAKQYGNDRRVVNIYLTFAGLAIVVSCLGLFGLSLFEIRLRYREIALRKVHGAQTKDIVRLVLKRYLVILGVSALIGFPLAVWIIHQYMADYAFRTPLSWWIFALALVIVAIISAGVLFWQVRKAANINPAEVMKSE